MYVGIATDGAEFLAYFLRGATVEEVGAHRAKADSPAGGRRAGRCSARTKWRGSEVRAEALASWTAPRC